MPPLRDPHQPIANLGTLLEFWQWAMSDLLSNANRGVLAEFIVGRILGADLSSARTEWTAYDLLYRAYRLEVKSSAFVQTWHKSTDRTAPVFGVAEHQGWDAEQNLMHPDKRRWADLYVFCLFLTSKEDFSRDVLDLDRWAFYTVTTRELEARLAPGTKSLTLARVTEICGPALSHTTLKARVDELLRDLPHSSARSISAAQDAP